VLFALATGSDGWAVPHGVTVPDRRLKPPRGERDDHRLHRPGDRPALRG
jgi:hypothetical protein